MSPDVVLAGGSPLADSTIRDAVAAVFRAPEYRRSTSLLQRLFEHLPSLDPGVARWIFFATLAALLIGVLGRLTWSWAEARRAGEAGTRGPGAGGGADWLRRAQLEAAEGRYLAAAHALYLATLHAMARRGLVDLHPSKTAGDYLDELRVRAPSRARPFRDFALAYETLVYGTLACGGDDFARLSDLAAPLRTDHELAAR